MLSYIIPCTIFVFLSTFAWLDIDSWIVRLVVSLILGPIMSGIIRMVMIIIATVLGVTISIGYVVAFLIFVNIVLLPFDRYDHW